MCVSEDMISRFLNGNASEEEKALVREYFLQHPQALEKYLTEESWNNFHPAEHLTGADSEKMLVVIESLTWHRRKQKTMVWLRAAVAVVLLLAAGAGFLLIKNKPDKTTPLAVKEEPLMEEQRNNTGNVITVTLPDLTVAEMQPGASLRYQRPFGTHNREVYLEGQALFNVKSNAGKPFTVFAGGLGTTALGTVFNIKSGNGKVWVQLLSGKVVVRSGAEKAKPVYLRPGEKLYYNELKQTMAVEQPKVKQPDVAGVAVVSTKPAAPATVMLQFENEPLVSLFKTIEVQYGMQVRYEAGTLDNMYFTGVYNSDKESLPDFLNTLALLNNVTVRIEQNIIYITP